MSFAVALAVLAPIGVWVMFSDFSRYDDEGTMLVTLRGLGGGGAPYTDFFSQYGPFWLELLGGPFALAGRPLTHDAGRVVTLALWLSAAAVLGVGVRTITESTVLGVAGLVASFTLLASLASEPMHPSALVALGLAASVALPARLAARPGAAFALLGAVIAALALTKINVGALLAIAVGFALSVTWRSARRRAVWRLLAVAGVVALPFLLLAPDLGHRGAGLYAAVTAGAALALAFAAFGDDRLRPLGLDEALGWLSLGAAAIAVPVLAAVLALGTAPGDLLDGIVLSPLGQREAFALPIQLPLWAPLWLLLAGGASALAGAGRISPRRLALGRIAAGMLIWSAILIASLLDLKAAGSALALVLPLAWVAALPTAVSRQSSAMSVFLRVLLPSAAITTSLQSYPVAATQLRLSFPLFVVIAAVCITDGVAELQRHRSRFGTVRALGIAVLAMACLAAGWRGQDAHGLYASRPVLGLEGASHVRARASAAKDYGKVVTLLRARCDGFLTLPGMNSFYLWTGIKPPSGFNTTHWWSLLTRAEQAVVVARAERVRSMCVVRDDSLVRVWNGDRALPADSPLLRYIDGAFEPAATVGSLQVLRRRGG